MLKEEKEPLLTNWNILKSIPFELKFPEHTIPASSKNWKIYDRIVDHPRLLLFCLENTSWKTFFLQRYLLVTILIVCLFPILGIIFALIFLLVLLSYFRFNSWKYCVVLVNPENPNQWHGWIRLLEHGPFLNLQIIMTILQRDQKAFFNYRNITPLFDLDETSLRQEWSKSKGDVNNLVNRLGSVLQFDATFDFDQIIRETSSLIEGEKEEDVIISLENKNEGRDKQDKRGGKINNLKVLHESIQKPLFRHTPRTSSFQNYSGDSMQLKEKYVGIMKNELEEREKLIGIAEDSEKKISDLRERMNQLKSENRKLKLENAKMKLVLEEKNDEIENLKSEKKE